MNHLEFARSESAALIPSDWEKWCTHLETLMGHSVDGDSLTDGYSMDEAYEMWEAGHTVHAVAFAIRSRGQYTGSPQRWRCEYCSQANCEGDCEPVRCIASIYADGIARTTVVACQWRIPFGRPCPNESSHIPND